MRLEQRPFVVLRHTPATTGAADHFDLLIDVAEEQLLMTWQLPDWPPRQPMPLVRQNDHRRIYLTYEGDIADGRGSVRRVDSGHCNVVLENPECWLFSFPLFELRVTANSRKDLLATPRWERPDPPNTAP